MRVACAMKIKTAPHLALPDTVVVEVVVVEVVVVVVVLVMDLIRTHHVGKRQPRARSMRGSVTVR